MLGCTRQSVCPSIYDKNYYEGRYGPVDFGRIKNLSEFDHIYQKSGTLVKLKESDRIIDLGCGIGHLSLFLYLKYKCDITGIDYSQVAINICNSNLNELSKRQEYSSVKEKVKFIHCDNENLPEFRNIKAVFLVDVIEHLYDNEIKLVLNKIKNWSGEEGMSIIIHTDNNNYLKFIRPVTDFLSVCLGKTTFRQLKKEKEEVARGHINLTTARKLKKKLSSFGFETLSCDYPSINEKIIKDHLGYLGEYKLIVYLAYFFGKLLYFLRPSFYLLASYNPKHKK